MPQLPYCADPANAGLVLLSAGREGQRMTDAFTRRMNLWFLGRVEDALDAEGAR